MLCINCSTELVEADHEGVTVDSCPAGCGIWVGLSELTEIASREDAPRPQGERESEISQSGTGMAAVMNAVKTEQVRACPECGGAMKKLEYGDSGIVLDRCGGHGAWLDRGELERVEAYAEGFRRWIGGLVR